MNGEVLFECVFLFDKEKTMRRVMRFERGSDRCLIRVKNMTKRAYE